jgi:hypothetical protein
MRKQPLDWNDKVQVCAYAKQLSVSCDNEMVVYKHPDRRNYNITHLPTFQRYGHDKAWIVLRVPPSRRR